LLEDAGLPRAGFNGVTGRCSEVVDRSRPHPDVRYVTSPAPEVGWQIAEAAPREKSRLELGSNAPLIVDAGSDWRAPRMRRPSADRPGGQSCVSTQRIFVHRRHRREFTERLVGAVQSLKVGGPLDEEWTSRGHQRT